MDKYRNFEELRKSEVEGNDYRLVVIRRPESRIAVIAPHGGKIEPYTADIAEAIAGNEFNLYCFLGIKTQDNADLHITSHNFDEPHCVALLRQQDSVIAVHGCSKAGERVLLGGRDKKLIAGVADALRNLGIVGETHGHEFPGEMPTNICNRGATNAGVQIEMSMGFRKSKRSGILVDAIRSVLNGRENR
jgi:phage replication-related protein YjqB (UPF0714/DUF867 family)